MKQMVLSLEWKRKLKEQKLINGNDIYSNIMYYCLHKLHKLPSEILSLSEEEQAFIFAAIAIKMKRDKEAANKTKIKRR